MPSKKTLEALHLSLGNDLTAIRGALAVLEKEASPARRKHISQRADARLEAAWITLLGHLASLGLAIESQELRARRRRRPGQVR